MISLHGLHSAAPSSAVLPRHVSRSASCAVLCCCQVLRAMADGADVHGTYYWTLMDNIEVHDLLAAGPHCDVILAAASLFP